MSWEMVLKSQLTGDGGGETVEVSWDAELFEAVGLLADSAETAFVD